MDPERHSRLVTFLRWDAEGLEMSLKLFGHLVSEAKRRHAHDAVARAMETLEVANEPASEEDVRLQRAEIRDIEASIIAAALLPNP